MNNGSGSVTNRSGQGKHWLKRILLLVPIFVVIVVGGLLAYGSLAEAATWRNYPAPGRMVDVGGYQLHLHVMGEPQGHPTIVARSRSGVYRAVGGAGHGSIVTDPRHAQVISASVLELLQQP